MDHSGLRRVTLPAGFAGVRELLLRLGCIQLDPLQPIATNADLVAMARVDGLSPGDVYDALLPGHAFEHFSKERCLLPAHRFPTWRDAARATPWWRSSARMRKLPTGVLDAVYDEIARRGPIAVADLAERGRTEPLDYSGWKGTPKLATLAVQVLWRQCRIVVCGREGRGKVVDIPGRALPEHDGPGLDFDRTVLLDRVRAAGLLSTLSGPHWSMLYDVRQGALVDELLAEGTLLDVQIEGSRRHYLTTPDILHTPVGDDDGRLRLLGPLDPMLWDRKLVHHAFDFEYVWEVYKPAAKRRWGWYVVPLLHCGELVGRLEAHREDGRVVVDTLWEERPGSVDRDALQAALARL